MKKLLAVLGVAISVFSSTPMAYASVNENQVGVEPKASIQYASVNSVIRNGIYNFGTLKGTVEFTIQSNGNISITDTSGLWIQGSAICLDNKITSQTTTGGNPAVLTFNTSQTCKHGSSMNSVGTIPMTGLKLKIYNDGRVILENVYDLSK